MAQIFVAAPFFVKAASAGIANVDRELSRPPPWTGPAVGRCFAW